MKPGRFHLGFCILACLAVGIVGCTSPAPQATGTEEGGSVVSQNQIKVSSQAFTEGDLIPTQYTCSGNDLSPALSWSGAPQATKSYALIVDDPDAPGGTFVHWVIYNIPASRNGLDEGVSAGTGEVPGVGIQGQNSFRRIGYNGPCPPKGNPHRYYFKLYALDNQLYVKSGATKDALLKAMQGHILVQGQLMGKFKR